jgi:hypothetical protein
MEEIGSGWIPSELPVILDPEIETVLEVLALEEHQRHVIHQMRAVFVVVKGLQDGVTVHLVRRLVRHHDDSLAPRFPKHRLEGFDRKRNDTKGIDPLGNQILEQPHLHRGVGPRRALQETLMAGLVGEALNAGSQAIEPGDAVELNNGRNGVAPFGAGQCSV